MIRRTVILGLLLAVSTTARAQQTIVFPAVADEVEGLNGSRWVTIARFIKLDPRDDVVLRRKWVCLPDGGFLEGQQNTISWPMPADEESGRIRNTTGRGLLYPTNSELGAVAYEVEGGEVIAQSYVVDASLGEYDFLSGRAAGQGQFIRAMDEPLTGPSHIPWIAGCRNSPCSTEDRLYWDFQRNNIGIVNPNPEPMEVIGTVLPFENIDVVEAEIVDRPPETFSVVVAPYGWKQFNWVSDRDYGNSNWGNPIIPDVGFLISLTPNNDNPYYAYASVVFSPDPDSGNQMFSDPMFVPAEPGYVAPWAEVYPPKGEDE